MVWYEHQPFHWILKNLSAKQITTLIFGGFLICLFLGSYHVHLDTVRSLQENPIYLSIYKWFTISTIIIMILFFLLSTDLEVMLKS
jgi:hypothetical protein